MPNPEWVYVELPEDPNDLTLELVLQLYEHPEVIFEEFARLTTPPPHQEHTTPSIKDGANVRTFTP